MRKILTLIIILACIITAQAQTFSEKKINFDNMSLKSELDRYVNYTKVWAKDKNIMGYIIVLKNESFESYTYIKLNVVISDGELFSLNPSYYTEIQGSPIIITTGLEKMVNPNKEFLNYLYKQYGKDMINEKKVQDEYKAKQLKILESQPDSIEVPDQHGVIKRISKKELMPTTWPIAQLVNISKPQTFELVFRDTQLIQIKQY